jgi:hypothetical protein
VAEGHAGDVFDGDGLPVVGEQVGRVERADSNAGGPFLVLDRPSSWTESIPYSVSLSPLTASMSGSREAAVIADLDAFAR